MGVRDVYAKFFTLARDEQGLEGEAITWADDYTALWSNKAFVNLVAKIEKKATAPISIQPDATSLAAQVGRANGIREIYSMIQSDLDRARRINDATEAKAKGEQ